MNRKLTKNKKGFTLAELLIVVAIIGVLVAISIPIFSSQLAKAKLATNQANARAAHAAVVAEMLDEQATSGTYTYTVTTAKAAKETTAIATDAGSTDDPSKWKTDTTINSVELGKDTASTWTIGIAADGTVTYSCAK